MTKLTVELPDEVVRDLKVKAARDDRKLKDVMAEALSIYLKGGAQEKPLRKVNFPLIKSNRRATPDEFPTPDELDAILLEEEARWAMGKE